MPKPIFRSQAAPVLADPKPNPLLISFFRTISPLYLRLALHFGRIEFIGGERIVEAFRSFQNGDSRLLIAFRHPYGDEPQLLAYAIARGVPKEARALGKPLRKATYAIFVHGYEVPFWMGPIVRWLLPRAGAIPVHHVKLDSTGIGRIRKAMTNGEYPLALAPEGQVSYTSETIPRLEKGFARIAFWAAEALEASGKSKRVEVLPISVHYRYGKKADAVLERVLSMIEKDCGLNYLTGESRYERLRKAAENIVRLAEDFYAETERTPVANQQQSLNERWKAVVEAALRSGERALRLDADGDVTRRVYRIRQAGWDRLFREDLRFPKPPLYRALADRAAGEAWYAMRHMELADIGYYLDFDALKENDPIELYVETALNYWDLTSRLRGGNISNRLNFFRKDAYLVIGKPLEIAGRLPEYRKDRKSSLNALTADLDQSYRYCVAAYLKEHRNVAH
ncbi:MAG: hypothetical protein WCT14_06685 [Treponemataceae bacterium]